MHKPIDYYAISLNDTICGFKLYIVKAFCQAQVELSIWFPNIIFIYVHDVLFNGYVIGKVDYNQKGQIILDKDVNLYSLVVREDGTRELKNNTAVSPLKQEVTTLPKINENDSIIYQTADEILDNVWNKELEVL